MVRIRALFLALLVGGLLPLLLGAPVAAGTASQPNPRLFAVPRGLQPAVDFWKNVFGKWSQHQVAIHDTVYLDRVYMVLDFRPFVRAGMSPGELEVVRQRTVTNETQRVRAILVRLHQVARSGDPSPTLRPEERKIWRLFEGDRSPNRFLRATDPDRLRTQSGLRERFQQGIEIGHRYWPDIERIFQQERVPWELTRLPLVESCFNVRAYSKVGAAGVWQFMPSTGRRFMRIDNAVDERRDPVIAGRAAARYLRADYESLGAWPLAITAYNHGRGGIARAVKAVGSTDIAVIVKRYAGPSFKFASRNFYAEFLAAIDVERHARSHFPDLTPRAPVPTATVEVPHYVKLDTLAGCAGTSVHDLVDINPSFTQEVIDGKLRVPRGYRLRVPQGTDQKFQERYAALSSQQKGTGQAQTFIVHRVKPGQTLTMIARKYGTTVQAIQRRNNLRQTTIRVGQQLQIPRG